MFSKIPYEQVIAQLWLGEFAVNNLLNQNVLSFFIFLFFLYGHSHELLSYSVEIIFSVFLCPQQFTARLDKIMLKFRISEKDQIFLFLY